MALRPSSPEYLRTSLIISRYVNAGKPRQQTRRFGEDDYRAHCLVRLLQWFSHRLGQRLRNHFYNKSRQLAQYHQHKPVWREDFIHQSANHVKPGYPQASPHTYWNLMTPPPNTGKNGRYFAKVANRCCHWLISASSRDLYTYCKEWISWSKDDWGSDDGWLWIDSQESFFPSSFCPLTKCQSGILPYPPLYIPFESGRTN